MKRLYKMLHLVYWSCGGCWNCWCVSNYISMKHQIPMKTHSLRTYWAQVRKWIVHITHYPVNYVVAGAGWNQHDDVSVSSVGLRWNSGCYSVYTGYVLCVDPLQNWLIRLSRWVRTLLNHPLQRFLKIYH